MIMEKDLEEQFRQVRLSIFRQFGKNPDMNAILFLIGLRELGSIEQEFSKEEKQDLMHIAVCRLLSEEDFYELDGLDQDGWPHWVATKKLPDLSAKEQEHLLKKQIIRYFEAL